MADVLTRVVAQTQPIRVGLAGTGHVVEVSLHLHGFASGTKSNHPCPDHVNAGHAPPWTSPRGRSAANSATGIRLAEGRNGRLPPVA